MSVGPTGSPQGDVGHVGWCQKNYTNKIKARQNVYRVEKCNNSGSSNNNKKQQTPAHNWKKINQKKNCGGGGGGGGDDDDDDDDGTNELVIKRGPLK